MKLLERLSGLTDEDPIHRHLKVVDNFMGDHDWSYLNCYLSREALLFVLTSTLGMFGKVEEEKFDELELTLERNHEVVFLEIVQKLRRSNKVDNHGIKTVLFWLIANVDLISERYLEGLHNRQLNNDWQPAW